VLAAASGGPPDVVRPGENGWLFPDGDAGALAGLIDAQLRNRAWTALDRAAIRRTARPAAAAAAEWLAIYARL
jgi:glycosyltransferase involved in cell wall biosynthesis